MWWSLLEISWRSLFFAMKKHDEENEKKFETERCTETSKPSLMKCRCWNRS